MGKRSKKTGLSEQDLSKISGGMLVSGVGSHVSHAAPAHPTPDASHAAAHAAAAPQDVFQAPKEREAKIKFFEHSNAPASHINIQFGRGAATLASRGNINNLCVETTTNPDGSKRYVISDLGVPARWRSATTSVGTSGNTERVVGLQALDLLVRSGGLAEQHQEVKNIASGFIHLLINKIDNQQGQGAKLRSARLAKESADLDKQSSVLATQSAELDKQRSAELAKDSAALAKQSAELAEQSAVLAAQSVQLKAELRAGRLDALGKILAELSVSTKQRVQRARSKAVQIGKGLAQIKRESNAKGRILNDDYWLEATDAKHRYGQIANLNRWKDMGSKSSLSFPEWEKLVRGVDRTTKGVAYLTPKQRAAYAIQIERDDQGNAVLKRGGETFNTAAEFTHESGAGNAIFVMGPDGTLYAGSHEVGAFQHSSLLAGGAVRGAGEIGTDAQGHVVRFSNQSGHYQPDDATVYRTLLRLRDSGVDLSTVAFEDALKRPDYSGITAMQFMERYDAAQRAPSGGSAAAVASKTAMSAAAVAVAAASAARKDDAAFRFGERLRELTPPRGHHLTSAEIAMRLEDLEGLGSELKRYATTIEGSTLTFAEMETARRFVKREENMHKWLKEFLEKEAKAAVSSKR